MFNKLELNNRLLGEKKNLQKAKTNIINKLVQKIRKNTALLEKQPDSNLKPNGKISSQLECLQHVKKLCKSTDILIKALVNEEDPQKILSSNTSNSEKRAEALIFSNKVIKKMVNNVKDLLNINPQDAVCRGELENFLRNKTLKRESKITRNKNICPKKVKKKSNMWIVKDITANSSQKPLSIKKVEINKEKKSIDLKCADRKKKKIIKGKSIPNAKIDNCSQKTEANHSVDNFFVTESGSNYLSTAAINNENEVYNFDEINKKQFGKNRLRTDKNYTDKYENKQFIFKNGFKESPRRVMNNKITIESNKILENTKNEKTQDLHPSWVAKQKLKSVITEFKGTKIVFD